MRWGLQAPGGSALDPTALFSSLLHCSVQTPLQCGFSEGPSALFFQTSWKVAPLSILSGLPNGTVSGSRCWPLSPAPQAWPRQSGPVGSLARNWGLSLSGPVERWNVYHHHHCWGPWLRLWVLRDWDSQAVVDRDLWPRLGHVEPHRGDLGFHPPLSQSPFLVRFGARVRGIWDWDAAG